MTGTRTRSAVDLATARLVRLVLDEEWAIEAAAHSLLGSVQDPDILRVVALKVRRADRERSSSVTTRAIETLDHAISILQAATSAAAVG
jgi:hypothetical protein